MCCRPVRRYTAGPVRPAEGEGAGPLPRLGSGVGQWCWVVPRMLQGWLQGAPGAKGHNCRDSPADQEAPPQRHDKGLVSGS